jgi:hypothetical protein
LRADGYYAALWQRQAAASSARRASGGVNDDVSEAIFHKYFDLGDRALANITLPSGERVLLTIVPNGFAVHRLHLWGTVPGRCLFGMNDPGMKQMMKVLVRDAHQLPPLPRAKKHQYDAATHQFLDAANTDLKAINEKKPVPGRVEALDVNNRPERPLSLFTRLALTANDADDLVRLLERTRNTVG